MRFSEICQLAKDWRGDMPAEGMFAEEKRDGWRCLFFPGIDGKRRLWSRNGLPLDGADHIFHRLQLIEKAAGEPIMLDGEIQIDDSLAATKAWFEAGWKRGGDRGTLYLFDIMPLSAWQRGGWDKPLIERKAWLREVVAAVGEPWDWRPGSKGQDESDCVQVIEDTWLFDADHAITEARRLWAAGREGLMLKDADAPYRRGRNDSWLKLKADNHHKWRK